MFASDRSVHCKGALDHTMNHAFCDLLLGIIVK